MIKNYLKIAFRNLGRHRVFSFVNIMGLAVGMTACFLIFLCVRFEPVYNPFHSDGDRILIATGILVILIALFTVSFWTIQRGRSEYREITPNCKL